jgi:hypothetical protein
MGKKNKQLGLIRRGCWKTKRNLVLVLLDGHGRGVRGWEGLCPGEGINETIDGWGDIATIRLVVGCSFQCVSVGEGDGTKKKKTAGRGGHGLGRLGRG